eukprot:NODE_3279_length_2061_cov_6.655636.p1 GENE.NODE_3279_length_2061_cov_6.655636~~NODE_3279_length_2061_cov_6.655636.p1  ORF type:complete len:559 (+),score=228.90 NODE_3279_length_2061_cov_6.655636:303-1979(+)
MSDEHITEVKLDWDGKRDRWNGFQADDYKEVIDEWERVEAERRRKKAEEMEARAKVKERMKARKAELKKKRKQRRRQLRRQAEGRDEEGTGTGTEGDSDTGASDTDTDTDSDSDASDDEDLGEKMKDFDKTSAVVATKDDRLRTTTRNLRIREDTAKYLLNLDVNSAFYDPKSRSMRQNPLKHLKEEEQSAYRGDNFIRQTGDAKALTELMVFAWDAHKHGEKIHDNAQPTQALKMYQVYKQRSKDLKTEQAKELLQAYGGEEHLNAPLELLYSQNENYVEYARDGRILKGRERALLKSKYEEDMLVGNHSSVWGSWYDVAGGCFGFACCHQVSKKAYCVPLKKSDGMADAPAEEAVAPEAAADAAGATADGADAAAAAVAEGGAEAPVAAASSESDLSSSDAENGAQAAAVASGDDAAPPRSTALSGIVISGTGGASSSSSSGGAAAAAVSAPGTNSSGGGAGTGGSKLADQRTSAFGHNLEDVEDLDQRKLDEAVMLAKKQRKQEARSSATLTVDDERKRKYSSLGSAEKFEIDAEEYEAYRLTRARSDDPMAQFT